MLRTPVPSLPRLPAPLGAALALLLASGGGGMVPAMAGTAPASAAAAPAAPAAGTAPTTLCYQKLSGPTARQDLEQLRLVISGSRVRGDYRWFPWGKDKRVGRLEGRLTAPGTARVLYRYMQEGQWDQEPLVIVFNPRQARISREAIPSVNPALPPPLPPVLLPQHSCATLQSIPRS